MRGRFVFDTSVRILAALAKDFGYSRKCRHFRRLAAKSPVSGEKFWEICAEGRECRGESLVGNFSISEIWIGSRPETGCASAETGSNLQSVCPRSLAYDQLESAGKTPRNRQRENR